MNLRSLLLTCLSATAPSLANAQVSIHEVCTSNIDLIGDEDGDSSDWIELWNQGAAPVDLSGWHLSDDLEAPLKWGLPALTMGADERLLLWASGKGTNAPVTPRYHPLVTQGDIGSYFVGTQEPPATWHDAGFDDSSWSTGPSGFGYGDGDDATTIQAGCIYIRHEFNLEAKFARILDGLYLHVDYDDAYVAHLNGQEIARENIGGTPGSHVPYNTYAPIDHEALLYQGQKLEARHIVPLSNYLRPGDNVLAIQVHNVSASSSDMSLIAFLTATTYAPVGELPNPSLIFKDKNSNYPLHTNFRLSSEGEEVILSDASGQVVESLTIPKVYANTSYGTSDVGGAGGELLHFLDPTPGTPNTTEGRPGYAPEVSASPEGMMTATGVSVTLSTEDPALDVRFTMNSSEPRELSTLFTVPLQITVQGANVLRARAFKDGLWPGPVSTNTYLVNSAPVGELPVFSLVTEPDNLWDYNTGIYVLGPNASVNYPYFGANFWQDWERPLHIEFFEADGTRKVSMDGGTKIHGGWSRAEPQKSVRLIARGGYGSESMDHAFFDDVENDEYKQVLLRNSGNDFQFSNCRDPIIHLASEGTGLDAMAFRKTIVYLNGEYWGMMGLRERQNEDYLAYHHDLNPDRVDLLEHWGAVIEGSSDHYFEMLDYARGNDLGDDAHFDVVASMVDTRNYATYVAHQVWANNTDWPQNNIKFWRSQEPGGKWRWLLYDTDFALGFFWGGTYTNNSLSRLFNTSSSNYWSVELFMELMENQGFEDDFIRIYADLLNTSYSDAALQPVVDEVEAAMILDMPDHLAAWNGSYSYWQSQMTVIRTFIANRPGWCRDHVRSQFQLTGMYDLTLDVSPPGSGRIQLSAAEIDGPFTGLYFLGVSVHAQAIPNAGYQFAGWSDSALSQDSTQEFDPTGNYSVTALFTPNGGGAVVALNELQYNPSRSADSDDWVELYNTSPQAASVGGWELRDEGSAFVIPVGTTIPANGYLVLARDLSAFSAQFPTVTNVIGDLGFGLAGGGERVELISLGGLHDFVEYDDSAPWPSGPDGGGTTLELIDAGTDNAIAGSWAESNVLGGTPGEKNSVSP